MLTNKPFAAGVTPLKVCFPSPSKHHFEKSEPSMQGFPQVYLLICDNLHAYPKLKYSKAF